MPGNLLEEKLHQIWQDILDIEGDKIGVEDNFFEFGGNSLKATSLAARIHKEFDIEIPLGEMFNLLTIKELANYIKETEKNIYSSIMQVEEKEYYPLSSAQKRQFILNKLEGIGTSYNIPVTFSLEGSLDIRRLEETFEQLVLRHEALRTSFEIIDGEPVQRIYEKVGLQGRFHRSVRE